NSLWAAFVMSNRNFRSFKCDAKARLPIATTVTSLSVDVPLALIVDVVTQVERLQNLRFSPKPDKPALDLPQIRNLEREDDTPIAFGFNLLTGVPGALANVGGLGWREADFHFLRLAPDHVEGGLLELLEVEVGRDLEAPVGQLRRLDALHGEGSQGVFPAV